MSRTRRLSSLYLFLYLSERKKKKEREKIKPVSPIVMVIIYIQKKLVFLFVEVGIILDHNNTFSHICGDCRCSICIFKNKKEKKERKKERT